VFARLWWLSLVLAASGCDIGDGSGNAGGGDDGGANGGSDTQLCGTLRGKIRDFKIEHPDFEVTPAVDQVVAGLVLDTITPGGTPTLSPQAPAAGLITSATTFADWYHDVVGVNQAFDYDFVLTQATPGNFVYDNSAYFPIDTRGWGNEGNPHNYHFTTEIHASFQYSGGEKFTFRGDDDVWVFVNGHLAIDIGGVHSAAERVIDFDASAAMLGIAVGGTYPIDFFQAERHVVASDFRIETSIVCFIIF
jgi:fibro-slime domain-containing protein